MFSFRFMALEPSTETQHRVVDRFRFRYAPQRSTVSSCVSPPRLDMSDSKMKEHCPKKVCPRAFKRFTLEVLVLCYT